MRGARLITGMAGLALGLAAAPTHHFGRSKYPKGYNRKGSGSIADRPHNDAREIARRRRQAERNAERQAERVADRARRGYPCPPNVVGISRRGLYITRAPA